MDLTKLMNQSDDNDRKELTATQQHPSQQRPPSHHAQSPASYGYRDYPPAPQTQQSPARQGREQQHHASLQHQQQHQQQHPGPYEQPSPYQTPGQYQHPQRPSAPPTLQQTNSFHHDSRSPSAVMPAPSPASYRHPQTPSASSGSTPGYPFPHTQNPQEMSPGARQPYPPQTQYPQQRHDGFVQGAPPPGAGSYAQQQAPVPQTPPVATSLPPSLSHQRSQSVQSSPTPTSANSQQPYGPPYHGSPMSGTHPHPNAGYPRQPSQPPTPGGAQSISHSAGTRPLVGPSDTYKQTPSPYQQRNQLPSAQASPHLTTAHPPLQRHSTSRSNLNSPVAEAHPRPQFLRERQRSISISPKTKVTPLPNHAELRHPSQEIDRKPLYPQHMAIDGETNVTPAKRKMEDRDVSPQSTERKHPRPMSAEVNGQHTQARHAPPIKSESPIVPRKTRKRRETVPRWAQSKEILNGNPPKHEGFVLRPRVHAKSTGFVSRQASPEASRQQQQPPPQNAAVSAPTAAPPAEPKTEDYLGPWEPSITGRKPFEEASKVVADEFFNNIIRLPDLREIQSLGIQFEIEAKLGQLIDRRTNQRVDRGLRSEAVLWEGEQNFRSSMSEETHKGFNDFLNACVVEAHPRKTGGSRVQIDYKHRREIDRFFDLTPEMLNQLPACVRSRFGQGKRPRVRVTHDQQKGVLLGKIVKARVCDIDLHMPNSAMDCRISINLEMNWDGSLEELEAANPPDARQPDRNKDRLSYSHGLYQIDLTQVTQGQAQGKAPKKEHELEIELSADMVLSQGRRVLQGEAHRYGELVDGFLDNVRLLARKANEYQR